VNKLPQEVDNATNSHKRPFFEKLALAHYRIGSDGQPAGDQSCSLLQVIEVMVPYRNGVFGHGAARFDSFYEQ
jgi:hypothetical protein